MDVRRTDNVNKVYGQPPTEQGSAIAHTPPDISTAKTQQEASPLAKSTVETSMGDKIEKYARYTGGGLLVAAGVAGAVVTSPLILLGAGAGAALGAFSKHANITESGGKTGAMIGAAVGSPISAACLFLGSELIKSAQKAPEGTTSQPRVGGEAVRQPTDKEYTKMVATQLREMPDQQLQALDLSKVNPKQLSIFLYAGGVSRLSEAQIEKAKTLPLPKDSDVSNALTHEMRIREIKKNPEKVLWADSQLLAEVLNQKIPLPQEYIGKLLQSYANGSKGSSGDAGNMGKLMQMATPDQANQFIQDYKKKASITDLTSYASTWLSTYGAKGGKLNDESVKVLQSLVPQEQREAFEKVRAGDQKVEDVKRTYQEATLEDLNGYLADVLQRAASDKANPLLQTTITALKELIDEKATQAFYGEQAVPSTQKTQKEEVEEQKAYYQNYSLEGLYDALFDVNVDLNQATGKEQQQLLAKQQVLRALLQEKTGNAAQVPIAPMAVQKTEQEEVQEQKALYQNQSVEQLTEELQNVIFDQPENFEVKSKALNELIEEKMKTTAPAEPQKTEREQIDALKKKHQKYDLAQLNDRLKSANTLLEFDPDPAQKQKLENTKKAIIELIREQTPAKLTSEAFLAEKVKGQLKASDLAQMPPDKLRQLKMTTLLHYEVDMFLTNGGADKLSLAQAKELLAAHGEIGHPFTNMLSAKNIEQLEIKVKVADVKKEYRPVTLSMLESTLGRLTPGETVQEKALVKGLQELIQEKTAALQPGSSKRLETEVPSKITDSNQLLRLTPETLAKVDLTKVQPFTLNAFLRNGGAGMITQEQVKALSALPSQILSFDNRQKLSARLQP